MRLLAKSGRKSQFYYSPLFREFPLRFHAARFPKVERPDGNRRRKEEGLGAERMWLTPRSNRAFAGFLHPETRRQKRESPEQKYATSCPSHNRAVPSSVPVSRFCDFLSSVPLDDESPELQV